jgi:hypothetical protein
MLPSIYQMTQMTLCNSSAEEEEKSDVKGRNMK